MLTVSYMVIAIIVQHFNKLTIYDPLIDSISKNKVNKYKKKRDLKMHWTLHNTRPSPTLAVPFFLPLLMFITTESY